MKKLEISQLPYLLKLLDDESPTIRDSICKELFLFGPTLLDKLSELDIPVSPEKMQILQSLFSEKDKEYFDLLWINILRTPEDIKRLGKVCQWVIEYQYGPDYSEDIWQIVENLSCYFNELYTVRTIESLAKYLFRQRGIVGEYYHIYNPLLENIAYIYEQKKGSSIGLLCLYILVANAQGFPVEGVIINERLFALVNHRKTIVDVFMQGSLKESSFDSSTNTVLSIDDIILQLLKNIFLSYEKNKKSQSCKIILELINDYEMFIEQTGKNSMLPICSRLLFQIGQIVVHKKYGYRGVIVDFDLKCQKKRLPENYQVKQFLVEQPWYCILVDSTIQNTYVPQSNIVLDFSLKKIYHPLIEHFFMDFQSGKYIRNNQTWP